MSASLALPGSRVSGATPLPISGCQPGGGLTPPSAGTSPSTGSGVTAAIVMLALERLGVTPQHRHSYRPILNILRSLRGPGADV